MSRMAWGVLVRTIIVAGLAVALLSTVGMAQGGPDTITMAITDDIRSLDPARIGFAPEYQVGINIFDGLVRYKRPSYEIVPDLAYKWTASEGGKVLTFYLRKGVRFQKGFGELTASDVVFSFKRHIDPKTASLYSGDFEGVKAIEAVDRYTVRITFDAPAAAFLRAVAAYRGGLIISEKAAKLLGNDFGLNPIGTGPFRLAQYQRGSRIVLEANDSYFEGKPKLKQVIFIPMPQETVAQLALENGQIDMLYARTGESLARFRNRPGFDVKVASQFGVRSVYLNMKRKPFDNLLVRQAIHHAINKKAIEEILGGLGTAADNPLPPGFLGYTDNFTRYPYDPNRARQLLAEAGFPNGFETSLLYANIAGYREVVPVLQAQLADVGIRLRLVARDAGTARALQEEGNYDMVFQGLGRPPDPDLQLGYAFHSKNVPPNGSNLSFYVNPVVDGLLDKGRSEMNEKRRAEYYAQAQQKITADTPTIPIYYTNVVLITRSYVKGHQIARNNDFWMYDTYIQGK